MIYALIPLAQASQPITIAMAAYAIPITLVALYFLLRHDTLKQLGNLREGLDRIADGQQQLSQDLNKLQQSVESLRQAHNQNAATLTSALCDLRFAPSTAQSAPAQPLPKAASPSTSNASPLSSSLAEAKALLVNPEQDYPAQLKQAVELLLKETGGNEAAEATTLLCEAYFWLGELATTKEDKERYHGEGVNYGKQAVKLADTVEAHLWHAANMGAHGLARGIMSSLFYLGDIEKHGSRAMALDRHFFYDAPLRLLGRFYHQCPGFPIGKGDTVKAIKLLEEAYANAPQFLMNGYYLADAYLAKRRKNEARNVLERVLEHTNYALMPRYMASIQEDARKLLAKC